MNVLVNVFHPDLSRSKVNAAWVSALTKSGAATLHMPYSCYPNWELDIDKEQRLLSEHDLIVFQFPFLWYSIPPLMKKWIDEVLTYGWAYGTGGDHLQGKFAMLAISTGCTADSYHPLGDNKYSMNEFLKPIEQTVTLTQMKFTSPFIFHNAVGASQDEINQSAKGYLAHIFTTG